MQKLVRENIVKFMQKVNTNKMSTNEFIWGFFEFLQGSDMKEISNLCLLNDHH